MPQKHATNGSFSKPTGYFSQISNQILRDSSLSLKAKGLYSLIFSYITLPNFTLYKNYLQSQCSEGRCSFDSAWKELVAAGYLVHTRTRQPDGTFSYNYSITSPKQEQISENAEEHKEHKEQSVHTGHIEKAVNNSLETEKSSPVCGGSQPEKRSPLCFPGPISPVLENQTAASYIYNKTIHKNTKSVSDFDIDLIDSLKNQIDYDYFLCDSGLPKSQKLVVSIILEYLLELTSSGDVSKINLANTTDSCVINEFLEHMADKGSQKIKYPLPYWKKAFINFLKESALSLMAI